MRYTGFFTNPLPPRAPAPHFQHSPRPRPTLPTPCSLFPVPCSLKPKNLYFTPIIINN
ncbi:MAG: hypothetical protein F6K55_23215 [Moorea sp. SIO4A3]|nr:hypothetical protein [Moorena sp. SIO4A3]